MLTIDTFAAVRTAELEGFRLEEALAIEGIGLGEWEADGAGWDEVLTDPACSESPLGSAFDDAMARARERYGRCVEPLESDLAAWVSFHGWLLAHPKPDAALRRVGLAARDLVRLVRLWSARASADRQLEQQRLELQAAFAKSPASSPPAVTTRPRPLAPREQAAPGAVELGLEQARELLAKARAAQPPSVGARAAHALSEPLLARFESGDDGDRELGEEPEASSAAGSPPPLVVPLPRLGELEGAATATHVAHASDAPRRASDLPPRASDMPRAPSDAPRLASVVPPRASDMPRAPSDVPLPAPPLPAPPLPRPVSERPPPASAWLSPAVPCFPSSLAAIADAPVTNMTLGPSNEPVGRALPFEAKPQRKVLPFVAGKSEPPAPPAAASAEASAKAVHGGTILEMPAMPAPADATPFESRRPRTDRPVVRHATPFDRPAATAAKPADSAKAPRLTLGQLAQLLEDLAMTESSAEPAAARGAVLQRIGLSEKAFDELTSAWRERAVREPTLFAELAQARESYRRWRAGSR